jgi:hypothetical protein
LASTESPREVSQPRKSWRALPNGLRLSSNRAKHVVASSECPGAVDCSKRVLAGSVYTKAVRIAGLTYGLPIPDE